MGALLTGALGAGKAIYGAVKAKNAKEMQKNGCRPTKVQYPRRISEITWHISESCSR